MKQLIKRFTPDSLLSLYHKTLAKLAAWRYGYPSEKLVVIGVTGTKGKSTTTNIIWYLLTKAGYKVGIATTANFRIGETEWLNASKMTMLGRTQLQKLLSDMVKAGCQYAIVETSSEGIKQWRHLGVHYDVAVWTNLFPEHIDAHGSFENYKQAKLELFRHLSRLPMKRINGQAIQKAVVLNGDSEYYPEFAEASRVPLQLVWSRANNQNLTPNTQLQLTDIQESANGLSFKLNDHSFSSQLLGEWNLDNIASALGIGLSQGLDYPTLAKGLAPVNLVPGRMERIVAGQPFTVVVDYAYEPVSLSLLYKFWRQHSTGKLLTLISSTGGGRDKSRRFENGKVAGELCDYVVTTDEDPYDDDPIQIMQQVNEGVVAGGKVLNKTAWMMADRRQAIAALFQMAKPGDVVFLTCKGADQKICRAHGKKEPWDDRVVAREELGKL